MSEPKRYYWLKLQHDFFGSKRIKKLRMLEDGDTCVIVYLKMQLMSIRNDGVLVYTGVEETFEEEIALDIDEDISIVKRTIEFLRKHSLILPVEEAAYEMPYAKMNTGTETSMAEYMRRYRTAKGKSQVVEKKPPEQAEKKPVEQAKPKEESHVSPEPSKKKETVYQIYERMNAEEFHFSPEVDSKIKTWFKYKAERKETYKETGLHAFLKQVDKHCKKHGEVAVCELMDECMSNTWVGVQWDRLERAAKKNKTSYVEAVQSRLDVANDWLERRAVNDG